MGTTQNERVYNYMLKHGSITSLEAFEQLGVTRLSARIFDLRLLGYKIGKQAMKGRNRFGNVVYYDSYHIINEDKDGIQKAEKG